MADTATKLLPADAQGVAEAARILSQGGLVSFPTETVYGLGADARNGRAVAAIYAAKGRPSFNPLIVHLADLCQAQAMAEFDDLSLKLAEAYWPGPLSVVLPIKPDAGLSELVTAGLPTVALRVPAHPLAHRLLTAFGGPVAAPSANPSGAISPTTAAHVMDGLAGKIDAVLDGPACAVGLESTIVACYNGFVTILRHGGVTQEAIEAVTGQPVATDLSPDTPQSPGQMTSHYAPTVGVRLNVTEPQADEVYLGFGESKNADANLSPEGDLIAAAANLFACLRDMDRLAKEKGAARIAVAPVPMRGLGVAINDRLSRAAAPRD